MPLTFHFLLLASLIAQGSFQEASSLDGVHAVLSEARGRLSIRQDVQNPVQVSHSDAIKMKRIVENFISIGMDIAPKEVVDKLKNNQNIAEISSAVSNPNFGFSITPKKDPNGSFLRPNRSITNFEKQKLDDVLRDFKNLGLVVNVELF